MKRHQTDTTGTEFHKNFSGDSNREETKLQRQHSRRNHSFNKLNNGHVPPVQPAEELCSGIRRPNNNSNNRIPAPGNWDTALSENEPRRRPKIENGAAAASSPRRAKMGHHETTNQVTRE